MAESTVVLAMEFWMGEIERRLEAMKCDFVVKQEASIVEGKAGLTVEGNGTVIMYVHVSEADDSDDDEIAANGAQEYLGKNREDQICVLNCGGSKGKLLLVGWHEEGEYFVEDVVTNVNPSTDEGQTLEACLKEAIDRRVMNLSRPLIDGLH
ncbi:hypothetical protein MMC13_000434 [Lambiella insularis]|nr:hypothetical protein [Lambiella insularis]